MFKNIADLVDQAEKAQCRISDLMLQYEQEETGRSKEEIWQDMCDRYDVMRKAVDRGLTGVRSYSGMTGGDAKKIWTYYQEKRSLTDDMFMKALAYSVATNEVNAAMGIVCATPTAGSSGVLPGVILAAQEKLQASKEEVVQCLFTAGAIGFVIANNACISGAAGGCQAEVGSASGMTAAALVELAGGTPAQAAHAMAMALKNLLGLSCDPLAGLVEVPCIKRNAGGAVNALAAAEMALAGVETYVPWDEVISAMYKIGISMPVGLRETATGGLAATETGKQWKKRWLTPTNTGAT